ncbi:cell division protein [Aerococcus urinaeequi]|uniref:YggT family protein n=1 Tax=Aerococcus urinaeequi TaxID=51665 RepID=UPI000744CAFB|nr:YggT family protein [Aerococcus urinaeequi]ALZ88148.1 cell division protein [Aerococcus urinaeequi]
MNSLVNILQDLIYVYTLVLVVYALLSWFPGARDSKFGQIIDRLAYPYLSFFDSILPCLGGISFSVIVGVLVLQLASNGLNILR